MHVVVVNEGFSKDFFCVFSYRLVGNDHAFSILDICGIKINGFAVCVGAVASNAPTVVYKTQFAS